MANLRRPLTSLQGLDPAARPRRWWLAPRGLLLAGTAAIGLLALAWFDGGEKPLRPIAEPVPLPEPQQ